MFVPAGVAHTFVALTPETRYLIILTERLLSLIESLSGEQDRERRATSIVRTSPSWWIDYRLRGRPSARAQTTETQPNAAMMATRWNNPATFTRRAD